MMNYIKRFVFFLLVMIMVPLLSFASEPIVIGLPLPLSGKQTEDGRMMKDSFEMAGKTINQQGGINGRPLRLVYADDQGKESTGEQIVKELVESAKAVMLVGGHTSAPTYAMAKVADNLDVPFLVCTASADRITQKRWKNIYRLNPPVSEYTKGLEDFWMKNLKPKSMSIIYENSMFGINGATYMMGFCQENGIDIRSTVGYSSERTDLAYFRSILALQVEDPPDLIYMVSRLDDGAALVKAIREVKIDAVLCGGAGGFTSQEFIKRAGKASDRLLTATLWSHQLPYPGAKAYYDRFLQVYSYPPDYHGAEAYSALLVAADALKRAESLISKNIREALNKTLMLTPFGPVKFYFYEDFERQNTIRTLVLQIINGTFEVIWPLDVASARFVLPDR
ncbi:MAG: ABC transporter substrate-binding protein [Deltaproteobacteria bacterium]|nr:ABC transporter substrate-binding protein [Deltaproteobacteria bacterium]